MIFGLSELQGFTSSPAQISISSSGGANNRTTTTVTPDVSIVMPAVDASELSQMMNSGRVQKVQAVL